MTRVTDDSGETGQLIEATARRILQARCSPEQLRSAEGSWSEALWRELDEAGLTRALEPPGKGELGIPIDAALHVLRLAGEYCAPVPLAESMLAQWTIMLTGLPPTEGPLSIAPVNGDDRLTLRRTGAGWTLSGSATRVPWARYARALVVSASSDGRNFVALVPSASFQIVSLGENLAREPRDSIVFDSVLQADAVRPLKGGTDYLYSRGAAMRVLQMAGALDAALRMTVQYVTHRKQFGRPLGKFQAIQQNIAIMAANTAAAKTAASSVSGLFTGDGSKLGIAAAKLRTNEAVTLAAKLAHQAHGAMGFTREYALHFLTKRLWSWRDEFGNEALWGGRLGGAALQRSADQLWALITSEMG
jgi:acyl-CoA dehydrogenase